MTKFYSAFRWFSIDTDTTIEDVKVAYRNLAMKHHPDMGGSTEEMASINEEFDRICSLLNGKHRSKSGSVYTNPDKPDIVGPRYRCIIDTIIHAMHGNPNPVHIEVVGTFIWVSGEGTYAIRDTLKTLHFRWAPGKRMWYLNPDGYVWAKHETLDMDSIRAHYGVTFDEVTGEQRTVKNGVVVAS